MHGQPEILANFEMVSAENGWLFSAFFAVNSLF